MKSALKLAASAAAVFIAAPALAQAQSAIMIDDAAMRAGPSNNYPRVAYVPEGARVRMHGCVRGFNWCDVTWRGDRGWVSGANIGYRWNDRRVVVNEFGPRIGLPIISFSVQDYWSRHYRQRPWWSQRGAWFERDGNWRDGDRSRDRDRWDRDRRDRDRWDRDDWRGRQRDERNAGDRDQRRNREEMRDRQRGGERRDDDRRGWRDGADQRQRGQERQRNERSEMRSGQSSSRSEGRGQSRGRED